MGSGAELVTCTFSEWRLPLKLRLPGPVHDWRTGQGSTRGRDYEAGPAGRGEHSIEGVCAHSWWEAACRPDQPFPWPREPLISFMYGVLAAGEGGGRQEGSPGVDAQGAEQWSQRPELQCFLEVSEHCYERESPTARQCPHPGRE